MNYKSISVKDARNNFSEIIEKAALTGERFLITKFGKPKVIIISADSKHAEKADRASKPKILKMTAGLWSQRQDLTDSIEWTNQIRDRQSTRYGKLFD